MSSISIWHWLILVIYLWLFVTLWIAIVRILNRTGYSGWWSLLFFVPVADVIAVWIFSKAKWPAIEQSGKAP